MSHFVNVSTLTLPANIHYSLPPDNSPELAKRFEFDQVLSLSGDFQLTAEKDYFVLKGSYKGEVVLNGKNVVAEEPISLFLLTSHTQEALFNLTEDFEILDENQTFDLEEVLGQYLYLEVCDFE
jgi:hypothetical protein